jgi:hypothetical protein
MKNFILCMLAVFAMSFVAGAAPPGKVEAKSIVDLPALRLRSVTGTLNHQVTVISAPTFIVKIQVADALLPVKLFIPISYNAEPSRRPAVVCNSKTVKGNWEFYSPPEGSYRSVLTTNKTEQLKRTRLLS